MFAGLPGTGIGGLFYLLLTIWMPIHEVYLTARGRSSLARWRFIGARWGIFGAVVAVIWLQTALMLGMLPTAPGQNDGVAATLGLNEHALGQSAGGTLIVVGLASAFALVVVIAGMHVLRAGVKVYQRVWA